jgi:23S rRNA (pseudouridine1915-N3)-methyltransferase
MIFKISGTFFKAQVDHLGNNYIPGTYGKYGKMHEIDPVQVLNYRHLSIEHVSSFLFMKFSFWSIGKSNESYIKEGVEIFTKRINHYFTAEWTIIPVPKNAGMMSEMDLKKKEGNIILEWLKPDDYLVALDEKGKILNSESLASFIQQRASESTKNIVFVIGGAFGLDDMVLQKAKLKWSLSQLTFPHQLVRLILSEQIYRACTILHNEKYHHK